MESWCQASLLVWRGWFRDRGYVPSEVRDLVSRFLGELPNGREQPAGPNVYRLLVNVSSC